LGFNLSTWTRQAHTQQRARLSAASPQQTQRASLLMEDYTSNGIFSYIFLFSSRINYFNFDWISHLHQGHNKKFCPSDFKDNAVNPFFTILRSSSIFKVSF